MLVGRVVDTSAVGVSAQVSVASATRPDSVVSSGRTDAAGHFRLAVPTGLTRLVLEARTQDGRRARAVVDAGAVAATSARPIILRLAAPAQLSTVRVRAPARPRPTFYDYVLREPTTRAEAVGPLATSWFDPLNAGTASALAVATPELAVDRDGRAAGLGVSSASTQVQFNGVRVPTEFVTGLLTGRVTVSPWDATVGGAAGPTVDVELQPAGRMHTAYLTVRSGLSSTAPSPFVPARGRPEPPVQLSGGATGPVGRAGYRAAAFVSDERTATVDWRGTVAPGTARALDSLARTTGVPVVGDVERTTRAGLFGRLDLVPGNPSKELALTGALSLDRSAPNVAGAPVSATAGTTRETQSALIQLQTANVLRQRFLVRTRLHGALTQSEAQPQTLGPTYLTLDSILGAPVIAGGAAPVPRVTSAVFEGRASAAWYSASDRWRWVAQVQARHERARTSATAGHATITTSALDALRPSTVVEYVSRDGQPDAAATSLILAPAISALYEPSPETALQLGARVDAATVRGIRGLDATPFATLSPRVALTHRVVRGDGALRRTVVQLRAGVGRFTDWPDLGLWAAAWQRADAVTQRCAGAAVLPGDPAAGGLACVPGSASIVRGTAAAGTLRPTVADRGEVTLAFPRLLPGMVTEIGASVAQNRQTLVSVAPLATQAPVDALRGEASRALLVPATRIGADGIVPTALVTAADAPTRLTSAGRSHAQQLRGRLVTADPFARTRVELTYVYTTGRELAGGLAAPGAPSPVTWGPLTNGGRHAIGASLGTWIGLAQWQVAALARSGVRYTPLVDRDVNGDGLANDRIFVTPALAVTTDAFPAPGAGRCIQRAAGAIAGPFACEGPWTVSAQLVGTIPLTGRRVAPGTEVTVAFSNLFGLARLGAGAPVVGGTSGAVNEAAVRVQGFDAASGAFHTAPAEAFGVPRVTAPFRVSVAVRIPLGPSVASRRAASAWAATRADTSADGVTRAMDRLLGDIPPIPVMVLAQAQALGLTATQERALAEAWGAWRDAMRKAVTSGAGASVQARADFARQAVALATSVRQTITAEQADRLPANLQQLLNPRFLRYVLAQDATP